MDLFDLEEEPGGGNGTGAAPPAAAPLAERMRPRTLDEFVGQEAVVGPSAPLRELINNDRLRSIVFWGPPGTGKTTLAAIIARHTRSEFVSLSAVTASIRDVKEIMQRSRISYERFNRRTTLFIDEIHRFNKAQQDAFLPFVEEGSIVLVGATTENPSFSIISALLSRCKIFVLQALEQPQLLAILRAALADTERGLGSLALDISDDVLDQVATLSDGDARRALNLLELAVETAGTTATGAPQTITPGTLKRVLQRQHLVYDKTGEGHFNTISAMHKAMRSSDCQAALYWTQRMLSSGEDPLYVARRMIRFATEDIGNADPQALVIALAAREAYTLLGSPEGDLALLQCAAYLATAPKSNAIYMAEARLKKEIEQTGSLPVPMHIRNAPTAFMKGQGYGAGYKYDHDFQDGFSGQDCLPDNLASRTFYEPGPFGFEKDIRKRMEWWDRKRDEARQNKP